jgi:hypothetical protein
MTTATETPVSCPPSAVHDQILPWSEVGEGDLVVWDGEFRLITRLISYCGEPLLWFDGFVAGPGDIPVGTYVAVRRYDTDEETPMAEDVDPALAITQALSQNQMETIVVRFTTVNPEWRGAEVADILDALDQADSDLATTEPFFEAHPDITGLGVGVAARALIWSGTPLTAEAMTELLAAAGLD